MTRSPSWSPTENAALRSLYLTATHAELLAALPGRTWVAINQRAKKIGVVRLRTEWTSAQNDLLRRLYPTASHEVLLRSFPGRTIRTIRRHARTLGLSRDCWFWSPDEDARLRELWPDCARRTIRRELGGLSWRAIEQRARHLGLAGRLAAPADDADDFDIDTNNLPTSKCRVERWEREPQRWKGYLSVIRAAEVAGYSVSTFVRILDAYQVYFKSLRPSHRADLPSPELHLRADPPTGSVKRRRKVQRVIDAQAARDAAAWWDTQETLDGAARRLGLSYFGLYHHMRFVGERVRRGERRAPAWWDDVERRAQEAMRARPGVFRASRDARAESRKAVA